MPLGQGFLPTNHSPPPPHPDQNTHEHNLPLHSLLIPPPSLTSPAKKVSTGLMTRDVQCGEIMSLDVYRREGRRRNLFCGNHAFPLAVEHIHFDSALVNSTASVHSSIFGSVVFIWIVFMHLYLEVFKNKEFETHVHRIQRVIAENHIVDEIKQLRKSAHSKHGIC